MIWALGKNSLRAKLYYEFMQTPDILIALEFCNYKVLPFDMTTISFFVSLAKVVSGAKF